MACTVVDTVYLGLGIGQDAEEKAKFLKERCRKVEGSFCLLWHNSYFKNISYKPIYRNILRR
jgi:hypothetical protein